MSVPQPFLDKMASLLEDEFAPFVASYERPSHTGLRVNTLKISVADFSRKRPFTLESVGEYEPAGFRVLDESQPGKHPYHAAGLYYLQEPSAMTVAALLDPQPGDWVLDLAAAPGGKATHLAARMGDTGLLIANDMDRKRVNYLAENLERWGARNTIITHNTPTQLADRLGDVFDKVLVDAPCSGEGMFRRIGEFEWSAANVLACARRQAHILTDAARLVKPGGRLAYATCTFSPEEDEGVISDFLAEHPEFSLVEVGHYAGFGNGRSAWGDGNPDLTKAIRLWPHQFGGEGHFIAIMQRGSGSGERRAETKRAVKFSKPDSSALKLWQDFANETLTATHSSLLSPQHLTVVNGRYLHLFPKNMPDLTGLHIIRAGLQLGEIGRNYFKPSHALALTLTAVDVVSALNFAPDDAHLTAYLAGHTLPAPSHPPPTAKWVLITVDGFGIGWGKVAGLRVQNHYPKGLRW